MRVALCRCLLTVSAIFTAAAEEPFRFENTPGKLPKTVVPRVYDLHLAPDVEAATFSGEVRITIDALEPVKEIILNSLGLEFTKATLQTARDGKLEITPQLDAKRQTLTLTLPRELPKGSHELEFAYRGKLNEQPQGLYITRYQAGDQQKRALATQCEATDARRILPCWDEPVFRAKFRVRLTIPESHVAISNMPVTGEDRSERARKTLRFAETPSMPSYLLALCIGELESLHDEVEGTKLGYYFTAGKREQARYAMEATKQLLPWFNSYFGQKYPLPKLDQIAFPSTGASGMENWGCIVYNDSAFLYDPKTSSQSTKERVFAVIAHEIAHQWFGNLVTMAWWDNLWLNEGFASWLGTKATDHFNPDWKVWLRAAGAKEHAMTLDARATTHPIQQPVVEESEAIDAFDAITYSKGQSILRMIENWLGDAAFRAGIQGYMQRHAYSNTTTADLWNALESTSGKSVRSLAAGWTEQPGFPVVKADAVCVDGTTRITLAQERFTIHQAAPPPLKWSIPVMLALMPAGSQSRVALLGDEPITLEFTGCESPVKANSGDAGYFRCQYGTETFARLNKSVAKLPEADRLNLLNDQWALLQAKRAPLTEYLGLVEALAADQSPAILDQIIDVIGFVDQLRTTGEEPFHRCVRAFLRPHLERLGWGERAGESPLDRQLRAQIIRTLGVIGDDRVKEEAFRRFDEFLRDPSALPGNLRSAVFAIVGRFGNDVQYRQLHELARKEESFEQKRALYNAMAGSLHAEFASRTLALALTDELVPADAARLVHRVAHEGEQPAAAWAFAREHLNTLQKKLSALSLNEYVPDLFRAFNDASAAHELEAFAKAQLPPETRRAVEKAADEIRFKAEFKERLFPALDAWCRDRLARGSRSSAATTD